MGSFPTILKFDSLGRYVYFQANNLSIYIRIFYFLTILLGNSSHKNIIHRRSIFLPKNENSQLISLKAFKFFFEGQFLPKSKILLIIAFFSNMFFLKKNCLFVDRISNLNYLPVPNSVLFSRNSKYLRKIIKFFDVNTFVFLDMSKESFIFSRLASFKLVNVSPSTSLTNTAVDLNLDLPNTAFYNYLVYTIIIGLYLKIKN